MGSKPKKTKKLNFMPSANRRINIWYVALILILAVIIGRLFYLQIIRHDYYRKAAQADQLKEYSIAADRGLVKAHEGSQIVPLVLNQKLYTLYADPGYIKDIPATAATASAITAGDPADYEAAMRRLDTRYVVLAKRLSELQKNQIVEQKLPGIGIQAQTYRTYPQNNLAAQLLGFVNDEGKGSYGLEQFYNKELTGTPGLLKAVTDVRGVPLAASKDNIQVDPKAGSDVILTVDLGMQKQLENILKKGLETARSNSGSALIMEVNSGAIKAMANWPSYNPAEYYNVSNSDVFNNAAVSSPLEVGSSMKILTASAALDLGVIKPDTTFYDPGRWDLDGHTITNIEEVGGAATRSIAEVLNQSVNTGATWILMQMGGGDINKQAREHWYDYMTNHFQLGKATGIEQGYEANGYIPDPLSGDALKLTYANTAFGQAMAATPLQMAAALSSIVNGGIYYQPHLVEQVGSQVKQPNVVRTGVVSDAVSSQMRSLMEYVVANHHFARRFGDKYSVGGKTGTAQIANPAGGYYEDKFNGTYIGFVGGDRVQYVIVVRVNDPRIGGYAGAGAAQPIFGDLAHMLIDNFGVVPKK
ncbi:hypothetical protein A3F05_00185 [Candidatus Saccharibacteria bacterium RIFCSPHIGHO2_12_FULL_47_17]|nr:MAG: hypothetical protein A3F05_00185 [Candidatus Saccharibacteria bacterium RIFCSPHIGHO2_12_FULL_47_17]